VKRITIDASIQEYHRFSSRTTLDLAVIKFWYKFCVRRISLFKVDIFFW